MRINAPLSKVTAKFPIAVLIFFFSCSEPRAPRKLDVPYVPTPQIVVDRMLDMAEVGPGDYLIDLGSGDGRIVISAAKRGANGHGVDIDPDRIQQAEANATSEQVRDRVIFLEQNIFDTELRSASVITMYLLSTVNMKLRPRILNEVRPGTRIVSHRFDMGDWNADLVDRVDAQDGLGERTIYYWVVPARVEGNWKWQFDGQEHRLQVTQHFQKVEVNLESDIRKFKIVESYLEGPRFTFTAQSGLARFVYHGFVEGDTIDGIVQIRERDNRRVEDWHAVRVD